MGVVAEVNMNNIAEECIKQIKDKIINLKHLNIIVVGKTGVGKSTLINSVFRDNLAETGMGKPVTEHMKKISKENMPLTIYDTKGFELGKNAQKEVKDEILKTIKEGNASKDVNKAIHCIWYCVNTASNRIEPEEIAWLREFANENNVSQVPIIMVLTQGFSKKNAMRMVEEIEKENLDIIQVVPVLAQDYEIDDGIPPIKAYGLDTLIEVMTATLPDELKNTLQNVQIASLKEKKRRAQAVVASATAAAFGEGFAPIPFADCAVLIPTQVAMIATITSIFGISVNKSLIYAFMSSALGVSGATIAGKTIASNLLKLVPGAGTALGGTISGATAGVITSALGSAYIALMEGVYKGEISTKDLETKEGKDKIRMLFKKGLSVAENMKKVTSPSQVNEDGSVDITSIEKQAEAMVEAQVEADTKETGLDAPVSNE
jgi:predicted GTPase